jgi:hypothetical protein
MKNRILSSLFLPLFLTSLTLLAHSSAFAQLPASGLVGYWPFSGNANDASGNGNNGTVNGATLTTDRFGNANSAYAFNGSTNTINCSGQSIPQNNSFTISLWIHPNDNGGIQEFLHQNHWPAAFYIGINNGYLRCGDYWQNTGVAIASGVWQHIVIVRNYLSQVTIFLNGNLAATLNSDITLGGTPSNPLVFGKQYGGNTEYYNGVLDEISIYNRALTPTEITQLYTDQTSTVETPPCPTLATNLQTGLVGYWPFCGNANDESGNGNNGTVNGATLTTDRFGNANSAYSFDGVNDFIQAPNYASNSSFTFSCWVNMSTYNLNALGSNDFIFFANHSGLNNNSRNFLLGYRNFGSEYGFSSYVFNNSGIQLGGYPTNQPPPSANTWHHFSSVFENGISIKMYLDGELFYNQTVNVPLQSNMPSLPLFFGVGIATQFDFLEGELDDAGFWNRALTPTEISQLYTNPSVTPPVACTPFLGEDQTVCAGTSVILEAGQSSYSIGQTGPAAGIIFHTQQNANGVTQVFEAAPSDIGNLMWGCAGFVMNQTSAVIGSGQQNTNAIISACGNSTAAALCANYTLNGADDWYLPSINELGLMFQNLWANGMGNYNAPNGQYWSSTENSSAGSMIVSIDGALPPNYAVTEDNKSFTDYIRPCRSFTVANNTYLWSTGATTANIGVTPTQTTTYTCTVTDANGNACTDSVTVFVPQIEATDLTICAGETTTLSVLQGGSSNTSCAALPTNLQNGLVGYWPFCGNANDASGNGNNGTVNGATLTTDRFGSANGSYSFDGYNDLIRVPHQPNLNLLGDYSISVWIEGDFQNLFNNNWVLIAKRDDAGTCCSPNVPYDFFIPFNSTNYAVPGMAYANGGYSFATPPNNITVPLAGWQNVIITNSSDNLNFFVNGNLVYTTNFPSSLRLPNTSDLLIGSVNREFGAEWMSGKLDDIGTWSRALTAEEIQQLYTLGQTSYLWSNGATTPTINVSPATTTTYTCTITTNGVSCTDSVTVVVGNPVASITPNGMVEICEGESIALTGNGGVSYLWNTGAPTQSITVNTEAVYTVTVTDANGCTDTESQLVKVNFLPNIGVNNTSICAGQSATLTATGGISYVWSPATGLSATTGSTVTSSTTTNTVYTVTGTGANGCTNTATATVTVNAPPVASITPNGMVEICEGESIALTANGGVSYLWSTGAPTQSITVNTEALYTVTVTDANGCTDTESQYVKVNQLPNIAVNNASVCNGQSASLTATGGLSYVWSPATGLSATTGSTVTSSTTTNTVYTVTGTGANGCTNTATAAVTVNTLPTATITPATVTTFCQGGNVVLNANAGAGLSYQWFNNATEINGAISSTYIANESGSYTVVVTNASTCSSTSNSIDVTSVPNVDYFADADGDGYGDAVSVVSTCVQPQGYVTDNTDCDDNDSNINTAATELCNHIDDDCSGTIDDGLVFDTYYADNDGDTYGDANNSIYECSQPSGYVTNNTDCNDNSSNQNAASTEICNGEDDDCDGTIDNGLIFLDFYSDIDGDGFGSGDVTSSCTDLGAGYTDNNTDCDDTNGGVYPGAEELCNSIDDNCDGLTDDGTLTVYFIDNDGDTYGNPSVSILACTQPIGYTPDDNDCNDTDANINPGAEDIGGNGIDENCDGEIDNSIFEVNASISLYPNPTRSELNIQVNSSIIGNDLYIFDALGKLVFKQQLFSTQTTIPVSNFADGNYVVRVGEVVKRFVVQK